MLMIRLSRVGRRNDPSYRIVVTEKENAPRSGKYLEMVGSYDPRKNSSVIDAERINHWIKNGAKLSDTVHNLLVSKDIIKGKKINVLPKNKNRKEASKEEVAPVAEEVKAETPAVEAPIIEEGVVAENTATPAEETEVVA